MILNGTNVLKYILWFIVKANYLVKNKRLFLKFYIAC